ncbi:MAG: HEAT repeat domain-containing protein [Planctomycetia bacterium]|nr:HEAT repeat domain-containing protein [Planctomycetia bacterium]
MPTDKYLTYRGNLRAAAGGGGTLAFVTVHPEGLPTAVYRLDADKLTLEAVPLPAGGVLVLADGETLWVLGSDHQLYHLPIKGGKPKPLGPKFEEPFAGLALLSRQRLAVLSGATVSILDRKGGQVLQALTLPDPGSALAADPGGQWLAAGTSKGVVAVFDGEGKDEFQLSESAKLHDGMVTVLLFEPEELRFLSAGADNKLLSTHARGKLEPEDKGRGNNHTDLTTALLWGPSDRLFTGSKDKTIKSWPRVGAVKPATLKDGIVAVVDLALVTVHQRSVLVTVCDDDTLRLFPLDAAGKFGEASHKVHAALAWAAHELAQDEAPRREAALKELAAFDDAAALELLAGQAKADGDHALRLLAVQLLGQARHPRAVPLLEQCLNHRDEAARVAAFHGLRGLLGDAELKPLDLALRAEKADIGRLAVRELEKLARRDDQALTRLLEALNAQTLEVRQAALTSLEQVHDAKSPDANLTALTSRHPDVRRAALIRLFQRGLLGLPLVQSALRRRGEDTDADVRQTAFLVSLHTRPALVAALRERDAELQRQLAELEGTERAAGDAAKSAKKPAKSSVRKADAVVKPTLDDADYEPLLQAAASRSLDTCLRGAGGLAVLGDPRAFGLLLQLSREENAAARAGVCRSLGALDDPRGVERLRSLLFDTDAAVRDAAFTALHAILQAQPLTVAEAGLSAAAEDVRRRGLQALTAALRQSLPRRADEPGWQLLVRALNDSFPGVRGEAFKAALNLKIAGGGVQALRFVLQSIHADVRREVLTEVMAQSGEAWAANLLREFFNDADPQLRAEAFAFAVGKTKELEPLETGLRSHYPDVRRQAVEALVKKHSAAAQALLMLALNDAEKEIRLRAMAALISTDAQAALRQALKSPHADVRVNAARALANHGAPEALAPLLTFATTPEPAKDDERREWEELATQALDGLATLREPAAVAELVPLLQSRHATIRARAIHALSWCALPAHTDALRQALQHADPGVKYHAALGLAYAGDPLAATLIFSDEGTRHLNVEERLGAAFALGAAGEDQLIAFLDDAGISAENRTWTLLLLLLRELAAHDGTPRRCLACLASQLPRTRLAAARALESFADSKEFLAFVTELVNDRGDDPPWKVSAQTVGELSRLLAFGQPGTRAQTCYSVRWLCFGEQPGWNQKWSVHEDRHAKEINALRVQAQERPQVVSRFDKSQLLELAFGAYVGLVREQGGSTHQHRATTAAQVARVRQTALNRILELARHDPRFVRAAIPVCVQALGDPNQAVRLQAFEQLRALGMDGAALGAEALEAGHTDLGVKGLELLSAAADAGKGQAVLEQVMMTRTDGLSVEAAQLLMKSRSKTAVAAQALEAANANLRGFAVMWLNEDFDRDPTAPTHLQRAVQSRYQAVRDHAALQLAAKKDAAAFEALVQMLASPEKRRQQQAIDALVQLGDPRAADALLDRVEQDSGGTALADRLFVAVGNFRLARSVDRLLSFREPTAALARQAVLVISGFDQSIDDPEDEHPDRAWEQKQQPRRPDLLARLMERLLADGQMDVLAAHIFAARWARGSEVDPVLGQLSLAADETLRQSALEAIGWRLRKRQGPAEPLLKALSHRDPVSQFLAAEGLARAGRGEGLNVLLSAIDFLSDLDLRRRAVQALGELADARALDGLLKLAVEDGHALQEDAAEVIGHLGRSPKRDEILQLLERFVRSERGSVSRRAILGLRWLDAPAGWQLLRKIAADPHANWRETAVQALGHHDDAATRELLLRLLRSESDYEVLREALTSSRRLWSADSLEPDYAALQNSCLEYFDDPTILERVCERGDPRRIFEALPDATEEVAPVLAASLLARPNLPLAEAEQFISVNDERTVALAAQIIGRARPATKSVAAALDKVLERWQQTWQERRAEMSRRGDGLDLVAETTACLEKLLWAAGRLGVATKALVTAAAARPDDPLYRPLRLAALTALAEGKVSNETVVVLETAALGNDPEIRALAVDALARGQAQRAATLSEKLLADSVSFRRLTTEKAIDLAGTLDRAASDLHCQGVVLPSLIAHGNVAALAAVLENGKLPDAVRLGALEGLGRLRHEGAEAKLAAFAQAEAREELKKAAWRALRRSQRARLTRREATT